MRTSEMYKLQQPLVLTGLFKSEKAVYRAQEVLTDFGYPKDAATVREVDGRWQQFSAYCRKALSLVKTRFLTGALIGTAVVIIIGAVTQTRFFSMMSIVEGALVLVAWTVFALVATLVCAIIGSLLMLVIYAFVADEYDASESDGEENLMISVAVQTPADARDIAREWEEIGGKVV